MRICCYLRSSLLDPGTTSILNHSTTQRGRRTTTKDEEDYEKEHDDENEYANETLHRYLPELSPIGLGLGVCDNFHDKESDGFIAARPARLLTTASNSVGSTGFAK